MSENTEEPRPKVRRIETVVTYDENFICPICMKYTYSPIYQCNSGHILCHDCYPNLTICPQCRMELPISPIRNRALEQLSEMLPVRCLNYLNGCRHSEPLTNMVTHENSCTFRPLACPYCQYRGNNQKMLVEHLSKDHTLPSATWSGAGKRSLTFVSSTGNWDCKEWRAIRMQEGETFLFVAKVTVDYFIMSCYHLSYQPKQFIARMYMTRDGEEVVWQGHPNILPASLPIPTGELDGLVVPSRKALWYSKRSDKNCSEVMVIIRKSSTVASDPAFALSASDIVSSHPPAHIE